MKDLISHVPKLDSASLLQAKFKKSDLLGNQQIISQVQAVLLRKDVQAFSHLIDVFLELVEDCGPLVPPGHREAACAALLTTPLDPQAYGLQYNQLPSLYVVFRVQLISWLLKTRNQHTPSPLKKANA